MHGHHGWVSRRRIWGAFIVVLGGAWLLGEMGYVTFKWQWAGPIALVFLGLTMLLSPGWDRHCYEYGRRALEANVETRLQ